MQASLKGSRQTLAVSWEGQGTTGNQKGPLFLASHLTLNLVPFTVQFNIVFHTYWGKNRASTFPFYPSLYSHKYCTLLLTVSVILDLLFHTKVTHLSLTTRYMFISSLLLLHPLMVIYVLLHSTSFLNITHILEISPSLFQVYRHHLGALNTEAWGSQSVLKGAVSLIPFHLFTITCYMCVILCSMCFYLSEGSQTEPWVLSVLLMAMSHILDAYMHMDAPEVHITFSLACLTNHGICTIL